MRRLLAALRDYVRAGYRLVAWGQRSSAGAALALACVLSFGCWLRKPQPITPTPPDGGFADASAGQTFVDCSEAALHKAWVSLLPDLETAVALGLPSVDGVVASVAATTGVPLAIAEVKCGLQYLVDRITHSQQVAPDSLEAKKLVNAQAWLAQHAGTP